MSESLKPLLFALMLCLVCSILLTLAAAGLKPIQEKNIALDKQKNILKSVGLVTSDRNTTADEIQALYTKNIESFWVDTYGRILSDREQEKGVLPVSLYKQGDKILAYIIPINSRGLWGKIQGYLALENDGSTVLGFTVYKHSETPGLGGEIEKEWFQKNFVGKKIVNRRGEFVSVKIARGDVDNTISEDQQINYVDGISGATLTGQYLSSGIQDVLKSYEFLSLKFRQNPAKENSLGR